MIKRSDLDNRAVGVGADPADQLPDEKVYRPKAKPEKPEEDSAAVLAGPWMISLLVDFTRRLFSAIPGLIG